MNIALLAYDGISPFMLSTPLAVFSEPFLASEHDVFVCGQNESIAAASGFSIAISYGWQKALEADIVILPGWRAAEEPLPQEITNVLYGARKNGAIVVGLCLGAFGLAQAGLLDGRRATTHWARLACFAERYPAVQVDAGVLFVDEGEVITSAGIAAGLDCCLSLLARLSGAAEANRVARHLVIAPQRSGPQPQLTERPSPKSSAERKVAEVLEHLWTQPEETYSLDALASRIGMSRRSLTRHIKNRTGDNLSAWLRRARVAKAQDILLKGAKGMDYIADECGFPDAHSLRSAFRKEFGVTPTHWLAQQRLSIPASGFNQNHSQKKIG